MKILYGFLCALSAVLPFLKIIPWLYEHNMSFYMLWLDIQYTAIGSAGWMMVLLATIVTFLFILSEGIRLKMKKLWVPLISTLCLGAAFGLPVFLLIREFHIEHCNERGRPMLL